MSDVALVKVTRKGQMTIPQALREDLDIEPGDYVTLRPVLGGILVSKATITSQVQEEDILRDLVTRLGRAAEQQGVGEEQDLEPAIEDAQQRAYQKRYGR